MIIIQKHLQFYGNILETYWLYGEITDFTEANPTTNSFSLKEKINRSNRQQWYRKCWNNGTNKISK